MALGTTGALIASAAIQAGTSAAGFAQAGKARKEMKKAEAEADKAMAAARKKLEVNYLAGLSIAKEPYELARENLLQGSAAALQAGVEGETRGAAATAGQVLMAQQAQAGQQRASMSQEINRGIFFTSLSISICLCPAGHEYVGAPIWLNNIFALYG